MKWRNSKERELMKSKLSQSTPKQSENSTTLLPESPSSIATKREKNYEPLNDNNNKINQTGSTNNGLYKTSVDNLPLKSLATGSGSHSNRGANNTNKNEQEWCYEEEKTSFSQSPSLSSAASVSTNDSCDNNDNDDDDEKDDSYFNTISNSSFGEENDDFDQSDLDVTNCTDDQNQQQLHAQTTDAAE
jgi:hypothetical protein